MRPIHAILVAALLLAAAQTQADSSQRLILDGKTDECALFHALNGSQAVPEECKDDSKSAFGEAPIDLVPVVLKRITFDFDSTRLTLDARVDLSEVAKVMKNPVSERQVYRLEGHTDAQGDADYNLGLSKRRARSVRQELIALGVPPSRLHSEGFGSQKLADPSRPGDLVNRRVEVVNRT
jgi:outer membrane protein OmpA-like peptidoglycan-associated protein